MRNSSTGRVLKPKLTHKGYCQYGISINGQYKDISAHRAVAELFIPNPENKPQVNHIDGTPDGKRNNHVSNLEWVTQSENMKHAYEAGLNQSGRTLKVKQIDLNGNTIAIFSSMTKTAEVVNGNSVGISKVCSGKLKTYKGFRWELI